MPKSKALRLIDQKIAQFQKILENIVWDNRFDEDYDIAYYGSETLLKELFSEKEAMEFRRNVSTMKLGAPIDTAEELRDYRKHIERCIAQLRIYRQRVEDFFLDEQGLSHSLLKLDSEP